MSGGGDDAGDPSGSSGGGDDPSGGGGADADRPSGGWEQELAQRWPMTWRGLPPGERWLWFERLWTDVCALRERYRLAVRSRWWEDDVQVEVLAALAAWVERYDSGEWDDPPGKLSLLFDLERVAAALREGVDPFHPERDRAVFVGHLAELGCRPPAPPEAGGPWAQGEAQTAMNTSPPSPART